MSRSSDCRSHKEVCDSRSQTRHSREGGNPAKRATVKQHRFHDHSTPSLLRRSATCHLDSRLRGNDGMDAESVEVLETIRGLL